MRIFALLSLLFLAFSLFVVSSLPVGSAYSDVLIEGVPHVLQKPDFCGEACAEMVLRKLGHAVDQDQVFDRSGLDPALGRGCYTRDLDRALVAIGFKTGRVAYYVNPDKASEQMEDQFRALHKDLAAGIPSIVCMHYHDGPKTTEHFRLVLGYDSDTDQVVFHEPAEDDGAYRRMNKELFVKLWPLKYHPDVWVVIRLRMKPRRVAAAAKKEGLTSADFAQHVMKLKKDKVPAEGFTIVVQPPFVVIGDEPESMVKRRAERTVKWAVDRLKDAYFEKDPAEIIDIWLFRDDQSYEKHAREIFGEEPGTPFGYYSETHKALVMNISTGGGTLVHEIVHPFVHANFPACPAWFNEGLGSLYEQCGERDGKIVGFTNWRLAGLQRAIKAEKVPPFKKLISTTSDEFYRQDPGTNYAQARYLCYYLQHKGLLGRFYREFVENQKDDPTGYKTLQEVLGEDDMQAFGDNWEKWVLKLTFP